MDISAIDPLRDVATIIAGAKTPPAIIDIGNKLFGYLALISVSWLGVRLVLSGGEINRLMGTLLRSLFLLSLAWWFMPGQGDLVSMVQSLGQELTAAYSGTNDLAGLLAYGFTKIVNHIGALGEVLSKLITAGQPIDGPLATAAAIGRLFVYWVPVLFMGLAMVMMMLMIVAYFVIWVLSLGLISIVKLLAPVFVPFLVLPVTSFLFDGWLRNLIVAVLYEVVGAIILGLSNQVIGVTISRFSAVADATAGLDAGEVMQVSIMSILVAGVTIGLALLMLKTGSIAQGLVSGTSSYSMSDLAREGRHVGSSAEATFSASRNVAGLAQKKSIK